MFACFFSDIINKIMLEFLNLKPEAFGLDISDLSLKFVKLKKKGKFFDLASYGEAPIKYGAIKEGEIKDEKTLVRTLESALSKAKGEKIKTKYVIASLPDEKAFLQVIQLPRMVEEDLKSAVIYEAENYIPLPIEDVYIDFQVVPPIYNHLDHLDILIAAIPREIADSYISCLKQAGLKPESLEIESLAISRALIKNGISPTPIMFIDLGLARANLIIFSGYSVRFTSSIPISSQKLSEFIAQTMNIDLDRAERLKIEYGLQAKFKSKEFVTGETEQESESQKIIEILQPALSELAEEIKKHIHYYQTHNFHEHLLPRNKDLKKIMLCGGGSNLKGLVDFLSSKLKIPVELANPFVNILPEKTKECSKMPFQKSLSYVTALGLAIRGIK